VLQKFLSAPDIEVMANSSPLQIVAKIIFATLPAHPPAGVVTGSAAPALHPPDSSCAGRHLCPGKRFLRPTSTRGTAIALEGSTVASGNLTPRRKE
jgi:hypothetical protein